MNTTVRWISGIVGWIILLAIILTAGFTVIRNKTNRSGNLKSFTSTKSHNTDMKVLDGTSGSTLDLSSQGRRASVPKPVFRITDADVDNYVPPQSTNLGRAKAGDKQPYTDSDNTFKVFERDSGAYEEVV